MNNQEHMLPTINKRYRLHELLGEGGMGMVYRATDRLTGQPVALKRVTSSLVKGGSSALYYNQDAQVALTEEFKTLAALRHPHVVAVLDYGFDEQRLPFFAMQFLEQAETILVAGEALPFQGKVTLLIQLLQALDYLHWRDILHRDLKPGNVMVVAGQVKVLDFGLSIIRKESSRQQETYSTAGTFAYMAPELFQNSPPSEVADLYAVGVIAYELFIGHHPFKSDDLTTMLNNILMIPVDVWSFNLDPSLALVLDRLLSKESQNRYQRATDVIQALCKAANLSVPSETTEIRESFLQTAAFVGRGVELARLTQALSGALEGQGNAWLVGGESGVGKSRILDELRTLALVKGMLVVRDQAVREGGSPYRLWQEVVRRLVLTDGLSLEEVGILKFILPDIGSYLQYEVPDVTLDPNKAQEQLLSVLVSLLQTQKQPILLLLEDLQWATNNSLNLLHALTAHVSDQALMIVGNYRDDEQPELPALLSHMMPLELKRLTTAETAALSASVLGDVGQQAEIVQFLQRETEGNPFFLVEVVRALAEQAGKLKEIGRVDLPTHILTGGLRQLIQRRLNRVPPIYQPLLQLAAAGGRTIDSLALQASEMLRQSPFSLEAWLTICVNAAILEIQDDQWQFAHDKLREGLLVDLSAFEQEVLHKQMAVAIEMAYPMVNTEAARLAYHWSVAKDWSKEAYYAGVAGDQALRIGANVEAKAFFEQALQALSQLPVTAENQQQFVDRTINLARVGAYLPSDNILSRLQEALSMTELLADEARQAHVLGNIGAFYFMRGRTGEALQYFSQSMGIAERLGIQELLLLPYNILGRALAVSGDLPASEAMLAKGIPLAERFDDQELLAGSLAMYATILWIQGKREQAGPYARQSLAVAEKAGRPSRIAGNLMTLGFGYTFGGFFDEALDSLHRCLVIADQTQDLHPTYMAHGCLGALHWQQGNLDKARHHLQRSLELAQERNVFVYTPMFQAYQAALTLNDGDWERALIQCEAALTLARKTQQGICEGEALRILSLVYTQAKTPDWSKAETYLGQSLAVFEKCYAKTFIGLVRLQFGKLYQAKGSVKEALTEVKAARSLFQELGMSWHLEQTEQMIHL